MSTSRSSATTPGFAAGYAAYGYMLWKVGLRKEAVANLLEGEPDRSGHSAGEE
jgi:hypothetical protein